MFNSIGPGNRYSRGQFPVIWPRRRATAPCCWRPAPCSRWTSGIKPRSSTWLKNHSGRLTTRTIWKKCILHLEMLYDHPMEIDLYGHLSVVDNSVPLIACRSAWRAMKKYTSSLEGKNQVSICTNLNRVSNNKHCKYLCVILSSFGKTHQPTETLHL